MLTLASMIGCGKKESQGAGNSAPATVLTLPGNLSAPPGVGRVPIGSRTVIASPPPGPAAAMVFLELFSEPGATIHYALRDPSLPGEQPLTAGAIYKTPLILFPPVEIWAVATTGAEGAKIAGTVQHFAYTSTVENPLGGLAVRRFPALSDDGQPAALVPLLALAPDVTYGPVAATERAAKVIDGNATDWSQSTRTFVRDPAGDVPTSPTDVLYCDGELSADGTAIEFVMATAAKPRTGKAFVYGFDVGLSNITFANFGPGADSTYTILIDSGRLMIEHRGEKSVGSDQQTLARIGDVVEMRVALNDLPLLKDATEILIRPWAVAMDRGVKTTDRTRSLLINSRFIQSRASVPLATGAIADTLVHMDPQLANSPLAPLYHGQLKGILPDIERLHGLPLQDALIIPFFYTQKEQNGFTGLNSLDRGMLTTLGKESAPIEHAQLIAHEVAHYHNSLNSRIRVRWFQEGMSEWSAERLLYRYFPRRAAQKYLRQLRIDHYWRTVGTGKLDDFPLEKWDGEPSEIAYAKSLMFLHLLDAKVGSEPLRKLQAAGVNEPFDNEGIQKFLEQESGKDLDSLFRFWVVAGEPDAAADPRTLFVDNDGDGLTALDEMVLGSSDLYPDSDRDGFNDDEEFAVAASVSAPRAAFVSGSLTVAAATDATSGVESAATAALTTRPRIGTSLLRLAGDPQALFRLTFDDNATFASLADDPAALDYRAPLGIPVPWKAKAQAFANNEADYTASHGSLTAVNASLVIDGTQVATPPAQDLLLPAIPKNSASWSASSTTNIWQSQVDDFIGELPASFAAYDLIGVELQETDELLKVRLKTRGAPDELQAAGSYTVVFRTLEIPGASAPVVKSRLGFSLDGGMTMRHSFAADGGETVQRIARDPIVSLFTGAAGSGSDSAVVFSVPKSELSAWSAANGLLLVCPWSTARTGEGSDRSSTTLKDQVGCVVYNAGAAVNPNAYKPVQTKGTSTFGAGEFTVHVQVSANNYTQPLADEYASLAVASIRSFEEALARPLMERNAWSLTVNHVGGQSAIGTASAGGTAYLEYNPLSAPAASRRYLVAEQLARVVLADFMDRQKVAPPYWIQETFVQWLAASASYRNLATRDAHSHIAGRFEHYRCYSLASPSSCPNFGPDVPLNGWDWQAATQSGGSSGPVKSMMFAAVLNATLGSPIMSQTMSRFAAQIPDAATFERQLKSIAPGQTATLTALFDLWVRGSGNSANDAATIRTAIADGDGDGLMLFEENALGLNPASVDNYLN